MTPAERLILETHRSGGTVTPAMTVATITHLDELKEYAAGIKARGAYTSDAAAAIEARRIALGGGK